jgi:hypothetical protein
MPHLSFLAAAPLNYKITPPVTFDSRHLLEHLVLQLDYILKLSIHLGDVLGVLLRPLGIAEVLLHVCGILEPRIFNYIQVLTIHILLILKTKRWH